MYAINISLQNSVSPELTALREAMSSGGVSETIGGSVRRLLQDHLGQLDENRPNALGGARTHFFARAARSVTYEVEPDGVSVGIHQVGIAQRYFGGEIKPVRSKYLTIPARAEAYGRRAGEFDNLQVLWGKRGPYALAERASSSVSFRKTKTGLATRRGKETGGGIFFWLVQKVTQSPDPTILPDSQSILVTALDAVRAHIQSKTFGLSTTGGRLTAK